MSSGVVLPLAPLAVAALPLVLAAAAAAMASPAVADLVRVMVLWPGVSSEVLFAVIPTGVGSVFLPIIFAEFAFDTELVGLGRSAAEDDPSGWERVGTSEKRCEGEARFEVVVVRVAVGVFAEFGVVVVVGE